MRYVERRKLELTGVHLPKSSRFKYPPGTTEKPCTVCKLVKKLDAYMPFKHGALGLHSICIECRRLIAKDYTRRNREAMAGGRARPDICDCCGQPPQRRALHWDHDHRLELFRGWLCNGCNIARGAIGDSEDRLLQLIQYLRRGGGPA